MATEFDSYSTSYEVLHDQNLAVVGAESHEFLHPKLNRCARLAVRYFGSTTSAKTFLDYGCGTGRFGHEFHTYFDSSWNYIGVDESPACIREAKQQYTSRIIQSNPTKKPLYYSLETWNENAVPYDFILAACVFHHIEPDDRSFALRKLWKLLKPNGLILIWEHNPWNPLTRKIVSECAFDKNAKLLSIAELIRLWRATINEGRTDFRFVTFFPGVLQRFQRVEPLLGWLPLGGQWIFWAKREE